MYIVNPSDKFANQEGVQSALHGVWFYKDHVEYNGGKYPVGDCETVFVATCDKDGNPPDGVTIPLDRVVSSELPYEVRYIDGPWGNWGPVLADPNNSIPYTYNPSLDTGAVKEGIRKDKGKSRMDLIPMDALLAIGEVLRDGAVKYAPHNWEYGMDWSRCHASLLRHVAQWSVGEDVDRESGHLHTAHIACNALFLLSYQLRNVGKDDRFKLNITKGNK